MFIVYIYTKYAPNPALPYNSKIKQEATQSGIWCNYSLRGRSFIGRTLYCCVCLTDLGAFFLLVAAAAADSLHLKVPPASHSLQISLALL